MSSLTFSSPQVTALAKDFVLRQAGTLGRQVDERSAGTAPVAQRSRLPALREVLASRISGHAGRAARHLLVDLDHAADCWQAALVAGADYRETIAASQLSAASSLGLGWVLDDRLDPTAEGSEDHLALLEGPMSPASARRLVAVDWSEPFDRAAQRAEALWPQARYALSRALVEQFQGRSLRTIANAAFLPDSADALGRFVQRERHLLAVSGLPATQQLEALCMAGDLVFGLGRCVRLGQHFLGTGANAPNSSLAAHGNRAAALIDHLTEALHDLADLPER